MFEGDVLDSTLTENMKLRNAVDEVFLRFSLLGGNQAQQESLAQTC
jgi:hypothetical protein